MRITVNGNKGDLYLECHNTDSVPGKPAVPPVGQDPGVRKINGKWLIVSAVGSSAVQGRCATGGRIVRRSATLPTT